MTYDYKSEGNEAAVDVAFVDSSGQEFTITKAMVRNVRNLMPAEYGKELWAPEYSDSENAAHRAANVFLAQLRGDGLSLGQKTHSCLMLLALGDSK